MEHSEVVAHLRGSEGPVREDRLFHFHPEDQRPVSVRHAETTLAAER